MGKKSDVKKRRNLFVIMRAEIRKLINSLRMCIYMSIVIYYYKHN